MLNRRALLMADMTAPTPGVVTDGLVFRFSGTDLSGPSDQWTDMVGGRTLGFNRASKGENYIAVSWGGVTSNSGTGWEDTFVSFLPGTLEICMDGTENGGIFVQVRPEKGNKKPCVTGFYNNELCYGSPVAPQCPYCVFPGGGSHITGTLSLTNSFAVYLGEKLKANGTNYWSPQPNYAKLSVNVNIGKIYEVRYYNRDLTMEEILKNQAYDKATFFSGG